MYAIPWPLEKLVARSPVMDRPAVTAAAACSPSGSKKMRRRPCTFVLPAATAAAHPSPIWVDGVIGYAPAASPAAVSIATTAVLPSTAAGTPGYLGAALGLRIFMRDYPRSAWRMSQLASFSIIWSETAGMAASAPAGGGDVSAIVAANARSCSNSAAC